MTTAAAAIAKEAEGATRTGGAVEAEVEPGFSFRCSLPQDKLRVARVGRGGKSGRRCVFKENATFADFRFVCAEKFFLFSISVTVFYFFVRYFQLLFALNKSFLLCAFQCLLFGFSL